MTMALSLLIAACGGGSAATPPASAAPTVATTAEVPPQSTSVPPTAEVTTAEVTTTTTGLPNLGAVMPLREIDGWLQSEIDSLDDLRGKVVVVHFWTFGCINCKRTLPNLGALYDRYQGDDFEIVAIHSPEFDYEEDPEAIAAAAVDLGVTWPIALDTAKKTFFGWQGSPAYWPRTYVLDREGNIRFDHIGEGAYEELNQAVADLLE